MKHEDKEEDRKLQENRRIWSIFTKTKYGPLTHCNAGPLLHQNMEQL